MISFRGLSTTFVPFCLMNKELWLDPGFLIQIEHSFHIYGTRIQGILFTLGSIIL